MLSLRVIPRSIVNQFKKPSAQHLEKSIKLLYSKDSSSSSSSDSDSDKEDKKIKKQYNNKLSKDNRKSSDFSNTNESLDAVLQQITQASNKSKENSKIGQAKVSPKTVNVAIKPKRDRFIELKKEKPKKQLPFDQQLVEAAKDVAKSMKGDPKITELELLSKVLNLEKPSSIEETSPSEDSSEKSNLSNLLSSMRVDSTIKSSSDQTHSFDNRRKDLADKFKKRFQEPSVTAGLLHKKSARTPRSYKKPEAELKVHHESLGIFKNIIEQVQVTSQLNTWKAMEEREIKLATLSAPQNGFQELIQWTNEGKIWKFPINNEQGMEEEAKIHFSEHIFMERHLKNWCPRRGPIRHFMELVCTGLSKNPYMTVEEKVGHITWYRDYFEDKKDLLNELELLDKKTMDESKDKKQIEA